jgi:hypothetical protein
MASQEDERYGGSADKFFNTELGKCLSITLAVCLLLCAVSKTEICLHLPTSCGFITAGRQDADCYKKKQTWKFAFFSSLQPTATLWAVPPPFEPLMWVCDRSLTTRHLRITLKYLITLLICGICYYFGSFALWSGVGSKPSL